MKLLALALVALLLSGTSCEAGSVPPHLTRAEQATHSLTLEGSGKIVCTAVAIAPYVLLTATHCLDSIRYMDVDGKPTAMYLWASDGNDHSIVFVDRKMHTVAKMGKHPLVSEKVVLFGHPSGVPYALYREGYHVGIIPNEGLDWRMWDIEGYKGDSGSALWNIKGEVVATTSILYFSRDSHYRLIGTLPYQFTKEQVEGAGIKNGKVLYSN